MDILSSFLALMVTLSMATERVTEAIKGLPVLSLFLAQEGKAGSWQEEARKAAIHIIAIAVGTGFAYAAQDPISSALKLGPQPHHLWGLWLLLGGLASGGSGIWNSTLDLVRAIKQQKEAVLQQAKKAAGNG
jgi:hypothetical protein